MAASASSLGVLAGGLYTDKVWTQTCGKVACWHEDRTSSGSEPAMMVAENVRAKIMIKKMELAMRK